MEAEAQPRHRQHRVLRPERCVAPRRATAEPEQSLRLGRFPFRLSCEPMTGHWVEEQSEQAAVPEKQRMPWNAAILAEAPRPYSAGRVHGEFDYPRRIRRRAYHRVLHLWHASDLAGRRQRYIWNCQPWLHLLRPRDYVGESDVTLQFDSRWSHDGLNPIISFARNRNDGLPGRTPDRPSAPVRMGSHAYRAVAVNDRAVVDQLAMFEDWHGDHSLRNCKQPRETNQQDSPGDVEHRRF